MEVKILVVEDDEDINLIIRRYLEKEKYTAFGAFSGTEAKLLLSMDTFDLIILDLMIPGITGEELIAHIREHSTVPVLVISARSSLEDKVRILKAGADDYMTKPFEREEVLARVEALLRRSRLSPPNAAGTDYILKQLILKPSSREVLVKGNPVVLTAYEFDILYFLLKHPDLVYSKEQLYSEVWNAGYYGEDNTINVHISNIRKKIKEFDDDSYIKTVWGIGFKIDNK
ncbi:response regulator transcription factor [Anaerocolumna xylanovorans]|uniref:Stage 0 sporulation protein A homolog n=1 Tax=Anaerocolumna xylanovorans DSM 12503 TaxID=1121345 RepID=A0A1M7YMW6_9FIRM|nr:response regulator transcription factor [Anaerocolumna xylanovorans]SHO54003.1 DNA-binding response regulator, OmpR family, contains REC and winged-helix (wHTH) domain [Anaerocolumna xylanovorans DSM 12503]